MDYTLEKNTVSVGSVIYDGCQEQPVDMDINLPDYCPDIQRILKCQIYPRITSRNVSGENLTLDGAYTVKVLYLDPEAKCVRCTESSDTFSADIVLKQPAENACVTAFTRVEYINCRATSPRKLNIHGAFSVCAKAVCQGQNEIVGNICGDDIEQKKNAFTVNNLVGFSHEQFSVDEILELAAGKPPADSIVRADAFASLQDYSIAANKLMVKGEISLKFLYMPDEENGMPQQMEYTVPFSQMLGCDGADETCLTDVRVSVAAVETEIKNDYSGEKTFFDTQMKLYASASFYKTAEVMSVSDAYSKKFDISVNAKQKTFESLVRFAGEDYVHKTTLSAEDNKIAKVIDVWNETSSTSAEIAGGRITFKGKYSLCVLAVNEANTPFYFERIAEYEYSKEIEDSGENLKCLAFINIGSINYRIEGSGVEVKTQMRLTAEVYRHCGYREITSVTADETKPAAVDKSAGLIIYFPDTGENLWDIARTYRTSMEAIKRENDIDGDTPQDRGMLLIPV